MCGINLCHTTQHTTPNPPYHNPPPPLHPSAMTSTASDMSNKLSIHWIDPNKELPNFADIAQDIQNWASCCVGLESTEARLRQVGVDVGTALPQVLWNKREGPQDPLGACCLQQATTKGGAPGALAMDVIFMKMYPKQGLGCSVVGASAGAINSKTHRKWVWAFIKAIAELVDMVVSKIRM
jgi:hypothetical protein